MFFLLVAVHSGLAIGLGMRSDYSTRDPLTLLLFIAYLVSFFLVVWKTPPRWLGR